MVRIRRFLKTFESYAALVIFIILFCAAFIIAVHAFGNAGSGRLAVAFLDVGQGDAIYIESPTGVQVLIDGGPDKSVLAELSSVMPFFDRSLDALVVTNPDQDHFAGFIDVLNRYDVSTFIEPGVEKLSGSWEDLERRVGEEGAARVVARRGQSIDIGGGAVIDILFPDRDVAGVESNTGSIIARLRYGASSVLLMGDSVKGVEEYLVSLDGPHLRSDILKIGHHGSRTSTSDALLFAATPAIAIISAGKDNRYGHPHQEVIDTLRRFNVETLITANENTVLFESDGVLFRRID